MKVRARKRRINGKIYRDWVVDLGKVADERGELKRKTRAFGTEEEAKAFVETTAPIRKLHGDAAMSLAPAVALRYAAVERRLDGQATIEQVTDFWFEHHKPVKEHLDLGKLLDRCVLDMELRKVRGNTISTFSSAAMSLVERLGRDRDPAAVKTEEIESWIYGNGWQPKTMRGYLGAAVELFNYAVRHARCLAISPLAKIDNKLPIRLPRIEKKEPDIFTLEQLMRLFYTALTFHEIGVDPADNRRKPMPIYRRLLGYLALATFNGARPFELTRLEVTALDLKHKVAPLDAAVTKMVDRRVLDLPANCVKWLKIWRAEFPDYKHVAPPSWDRLLKGLRAAAQLRPWPHDVLRHTFASYFHATHEDKTKLQNQMGHSEDEDTLDKYYRAVRFKTGEPITKKLASKIWLITPELVKKWRPGETLALLKG